jgi:two-component system nitrogen regulation response regulator GlnG
MDKLASPFPDLEHFISERIRAGSWVLYAEIIEKIDRQVITQVLKYTGGNQFRAAGILGITRGSLRKKMRCLGIVIERNVSIGEKKFQRKIL